MSFDVREDGNSLVMKLSFQAPKTKVWQAWTTPELLAKWWSPDGWETTVKHFDFSNGGYWEYEMKCIDPEQPEWFGQKSAGKSTYDNINPEESFENVDYFLDDTNNVNTEAPVSHSLIEFTENDDGTTTVTSTARYNSKDELEQVLAMGMREGLEQSWKKLASVVEEK